MLWIIVVVLVVLWLLGFFGPEIQFQYPQNWQPCSHTDRHRCHSPHLEAPWGAVDLSSFDD